MGTPVDRSVELLLALALLVPVGAAGTTGGTLLDAEGNLTVGTAGVGLGDPDGVLPGDTDAFDPVSHAVHGFTVPECPHFLGVRGQARTLDTDPGTWEDAGLFDPALIRLELRAPNGTTLASEFGSEPAFTTDEAVAPGGYELHVFHLVGGPITYEAAVDGGPAPACG